MFSLRTKKKIKKLEGKEKIYKNFLSLKEVKELIEIERKSLKFFVDKPEGRKRGFGVKGDKTVRDTKNWHPKIKKIILPKIKKIFPKFKISKDEFPPHYFNNEYPTVMHADTGRNKNAIIFKQILIPLKIIPSKKKIFNEVYTIIFNRRWYGPASTFRHKINDQKNSTFDYTIKDSNSKFIKIKDLRVFYEKIKKLNNINFKYEDGKFKITNNFKKKIFKILKNPKKRYNQFSNKHITNKRKFSRILYKKYLTHQPIEDFQSLKIDTLYNWSIGDMLVWDRSKLHSSNDYSKYGIKRKIGFSIFLSYPK